MMSDDRKDYVDLEIEENSFNFPIKRVVPLQKRLPPSPIGSTFYSSEPEPVNRSAEGNISVSGDGNLQSPDRRNMTVGMCTPDSSPGTPTIFRHNPEGSAFKRVESPHVNKTSALRDSSSFTPGLVFSPDKSNRAKYDKSSIGDKAIDSERSRNKYVIGESSSSSNSTMGDDYGYLGAFEHHIRFPTPLSKVDRYSNESQEEEGIHGHGLSLDFGSPVLNYDYSDTTDSSFSDSLFGSIKSNGQFRGHSNGQQHLSNNQGPSSPDIMGIVTQLVNSQLPPHRFIRDLINQSHGEKEEEGEDGQSIAKSLRYGSDHDPRVARSYESLYSDDGSKGRPDDDSLSASYSMGALIGPAVNFNKSWEQNNDTRRSGEFNARMGIVTNAVTMTDQNNLIDNQIPVRVTSGYTSTADFAQPRISNPFLSDNKSFEEYQQIPISQQQNNHNTLYQQSSQPSTLMQQQQQQQQQRPIQYHKDSGSNMLPQYQTQSQFNNGTGQSMFSDLPQPPIASHNLGGADPSFILPKYSGEPSFFSSTNSNIHPNSNMIHEHILQSEIEEPLSNSGTWTSSGGRGGNLSHSHQQHPQHNQHLDSPSQRLSDRNFNPSTPTTNRLSRSEDLTGNNR